MTFTTRALTLILTLRASPGRALGLDPFFSRGRRTRRTTFWLSLSFLRVVVIAGGFLELALRSGGPHFRWHGVNSEYQRGEETRSRLVLTKRRREKCGWTPENTNEHVLSGLSDQARLNQTPQARLICHSTRVTRPCLQTRFLSPCEFRVRLILYYSNGGILQGRVVKL